MQDICQVFQKTREESVRRCEPLAIEDYGVQPCAEVSPPKWHLAHTTWFFEKFILSPYHSPYQVCHEGYDFLFNSYYQAFGTKLARDTRFLASRPTVKEVLEYRQYVDDHMLELLSKADPNVQKLTILGIHHEQQHQELLMMDILNIFALNPLRPTYQKNAIGTIESSSPRWCKVAGDDYAIGFEGSGFSYDNEAPLHRQKLSPFAIRDQLVTNAEYLEFMESGGYENYEYWLADGWDWVLQNQISHPLYWQHAGDHTGGVWQEMTLAGLQPLQASQPVRHVSYYEAVAFAAWKQARLATEAEREVAERLETGLQQTGWLWEWTQSPYMPYPGYRPPAGAIGEYNGKFMCNQMVLRGGCFATPQNHYRPSYRNFYYPQQRWMFSGIRLVRDE